MEPTLILLLITLIAGVVFLLIFLPIAAVRKKYINFVNAHSIALKQLSEINKKYLFKRVSNCDMTHSYDNANMYKDITCLDYLTYQLVYEQKKVKNAIKDTLDNKNLYTKYTNEIKYTCVFDKWDTENLLKNRNRLIKYEQRLFKRNSKAPTILFTITVVLKLTNINGVYKRSKRQTFGPKEIADTITKLNQKRGKFYLNNEIWQSICRVERGRVTNRMRFAIYKRDHYRCRKCGRKTNDLEVDHIFPIAKGGKSTFDNLQTLCHRCNYIKGSRIE